MRDWNRLIIKVGVTFTCLFVLKSLKIPVFSGTLTHGFFRYQSGEYSPNHQDEALDDTFGDESGNFSKFLKSQEEKFHSPNKTRDLDYISLATSEVDNETVDLSGSRDSIREPVPNILDEILDSDNISYSVPVFKSVNSEEIFQVSPGKCRSCALVMSSGYLLESKAGLSIDSHDCVFRFNLAPVKNYEPIVGSKTTIRLISHTCKAQDLLKVLKQEDPKVEQSLLFFHPSDKHTYVEKKAKHLSETLNNTSLKIFVAEKNSAAYFQKFFTATTGEELEPHPDHIWLTTGFVGVVTSLHVCDSITIFGAVQKHHCDSGLISKSAPYNYYKKDVASMCGYMKKKQWGHSFFKEHQVYQLWAKRRKIKTLFPSS